MYEWLYWDRNISLSKKFQNGKFLSYWHKSCTKSIFSGATFTLIGNKEKFTTEDVNWL